MKKIFIIAIISACGLGAHSQVINSVSNYRHEEKVIKERIPLKYEWYGKVGLNMMSTRWIGQFGEDEQLEGNKTKIGFNLDLGLISHFRPSRPSNFYWGAELSITQVGGGFDSVEYHRKTSSSSEERIYDSYSYTGYGICVGPTLGWKKHLSSSLQLDLHFSPELLLFLSTPKDLSYEFDYTYDYSWSKPSHSSGSSSREFEKSLPNLALKGGVGVWIDRFNVDLSYRGTTAFDDIYNNYSSIILSVGYRF